MDIKLIRAFIASPGGLDAERLAARAAAEEVNRSVAKPLGGRLELIGWEETLSGSGRPQAIINSDMEVCDLFIGLIWTRWGSKPSDTGEFTSGFEEEFELSRARFTRTKSPIMAMFFKDVDTQQVQDPGKELGKVLAFQERLRDERTFLYDSFDTAETFAAKVRIFLSTHVIALLRAPSEPLEDQPVSAAALPERGGMGSEAKKQERATEAQFLESAAATLRTDSNATPTDIARIRLVACALATDANDKLVLAVHDANLLYWQRENLVLSTLETRALVDSGLTEITKENVPIWSWLAELTTGRPYLLTAMTAYGEDERRAGALTAMRLLGEPIKPFMELSPDAIIENWLRDGGPAQVKVEALKYLGTRGKRIHLKHVLTEVEKADKDTLQAANEAVVSIYLRENTQEAARHILATSFESFNGELLRQALQQMEVLPTEEVRKGLDHRSYVVRARAIAILSERNSIDLPTVKRALEDDQAKVRLEGIYALTRLDQTPSIEEANNILSRTRRGGVLMTYTDEKDSEGEWLFGVYRATRFRHMPRATLETLLDVDEHRDAAFCALAAQRVANYGVELRANLLDGFEGYVSRWWPKGLPALRPNSLLSIFSPNTEDPTRTKRTALVEAALDIVALQKDQADLSLVRQVLDTGMVQPSASVIEYLKTVGSAEDTQRLFKTRQISIAGWYADRAFDRDFNEAAATILKLNAGQLGVLLAVEMPDEMRARIVTHSTFTDFSKLNNESVLNLLITENTELRRAAACKIATSFDRPRVKRLLTAYRENPEGRYYLVAHWLDLALGFSKTVSRRVIASR